jgi:tripartite-type tricarboxylate transporter receptor subunit TctC
MTNRIARIAAGALAAFMALSPVRAQTDVLPQGTITFVLPFVAGGPVDAVARLLTEKLSTRFGRTFVVENKAGAGGDIAAGTVARAAPDGATWFFTVDSVLTINPHMNANQGYDPAALTGVAKVGEVVLALGVNAKKVPAASFAELVAQSAKQELSFASAGVGSPGHLAFEYLRAVSPLKGVHVPYRGAALALQDLLSGNVDAAFIVSGVLVPHIEAGSVRALAVSSAKRTPELPNVPTAQEAGIPDFEARFANLLMAPAKTPTPILQAMESAVLEIARTPEFGERLKRLSTAQELSGGAEANAWIAREKARWGKVTAANKPAK